MRIFMTGATGLVGSAVMQELLATGHEVLGLARSAASEEDLANAGARAVQGSLKDLDALRKGAAACDGAIHLGFGDDFSKFVENCEIDRLAIEAMGSVFKGTGKPLIVPNGMAGLAPPGHVLAETDNVPADYRFPRVSEQTALRLAAEGVTAVVIRLPQVHTTVRQGFVTRLVQVARSEGIAVYPGEGRNRWPAAHVLDVARIFRLVLETPVAGRRYHAVAEEGIELRVIADTISQALNVPTKSLQPGDVQELFGPLATFIGADMPASSAATRQQMHWEPAGPTLATDLACLK